MVSPPHNLHKFVFFKYFYYIRAKPLTFKTMNKKIDFSYLLPSNITLDEYVKADVLPSDIEVTPLIPLRDLNRKEIKTIAQAAAGDETASTYLNNR